MTAHIDEEVGAVPPAPANEVQAAAKRLFTRNTIPASPPLVSGSGALVRDVNGKEYIDCCAQTLNMNLGQCHPEVLDAIVRQATNLTYASSRFASDVAVELAQKLVDLTPPNLTRVNLKNTSGSSANECAIKAARKASGASTIVSLDNSHVGQTLEMMKISGKHWDVPYVRDRQTRFLPTPYCHRCPMGKKPESCHTECLDGLDAAVREEAIAAVIVEPIMVDAGVLAPPPRYHERLRAVCNANDVALIFDEVQTAFGWLGTMFACNYFGVAPDILSLGKGISAGMPLAATMVDEKYDVLGYGEHEITYGAHPISCAASLAAIRYLENGGLSEAAEKGAYAMERLRAIAARSRVLGDVRGVGLLIGLEFERPDGMPDSALAREIFERMLDRGVVLRISTVGKNSNVLQFKPPIVITYEQLDVVFATLADVVTNAGA